MKSKKVLINRKKEKITVNKNVKWQLKEAVK